jgi:hypothetical protein
VPPTKSKKKKRKFLTSLAKDDMVLDLRNKMKRERRRSLNRIDDLTATEAKLRFFQTKLLKRIRKLKSGLRSELKKYYENLIDRSRDPGVELAQNPDGSWGIKATQKPDTEKLRAGAMGGAGGAWTPVKAPVRITTKAEVDALAPGTEFIGPDNVKRVK